MAVAGHWSLWQLNGFSLSANSTVAASDSGQVGRDPPLKNLVAKEIAYIVDKSSSYDVDVVWLDASGNTIEKENLESASTGESVGTVPMRSPFWDVEITDNSGSQENVEASFHAH
ncbi:MAG: hypothetical protein SVU88_02275 [Candidatus Nanohaloarchaea archaeon]|nr:hypothetical protein [Candidatus Nanohaloarchaea archaeon]